MKPSKMSACLEGAGPPPTYEELVEQVKQLQKSDTELYGAVVGWSPDTPREQLFKRHGELVTAKFSQEFGLYGHQDMELHVIRLCLDVIELSDMLGKKLRAPTPQDYEGGKL